MDTPTILVIAGATILVLVVVITLIVMLLQRGGSGRRSTPGQLTQTPRQGQRRGDYVPPQPRPAILPPSPPSQVGSTSLPPRPARWESGTSGVLPPELPRRAPPVAAASPVGAAQRLSQEAAKLRGNGFESVTFARRPDVEEYCVLVRVARGDENVSLHLICGRDYPSLAPRLVATVETFDAHGELVEQRLAVESPVLQSWGPASSLFAVVNSVLSALPRASPDGSAPSPEPIFTRYTEIID